MGAGGQQPLRSQPLSRGVDSTLRRPGKAEALTVKIRDIRSVRVRNAKCGPGIREPTTYDRCHGGATRALWRLASAERPSRGSVNLDPPRGQVELLKNGAGRPAPFL
jgi:hypothetical protein